ncbi:GNAT family N-acetyltransferase [Pseudobacteroides cellulosolvens]|uniref:GCN5-related N-acetyltransferase n=1 Tax=Pseudobacteroides cellulosolvens ATCC 35603 = DSM 2933 TaxID=398512 RepID=A0A0L6JL93_9FIRM|nr:GNAT family N-acetyltransferase [Pseudobacteroides cellulosolvens]KNY26152.1 GCN5-related N-acetyltransferase [Pseudobacteroides cellulosolvens ATCC 35603 = DSM 2933]
MNLRDIKEGDAGQILELVKICGPYVAPYNVYAYWILENYYSSTCKVVEDLNRIIGYVSGMPSVDKGTLFIWQICVHNDYRGKGVATLLLDSLFKKAKEYMFEKIELSISESNYASQKLFKNYSEKNNLKIIEINRCVFGDITEIVYEISLT